MATLEDVNPLAVPIGNMMPIGRDELGNPVYRNALTGATYMLTQPQPDQGSGFSWGGMMNALAAPFRLAGGRGTDADVAAVENALAGVLQGVTAPGRAAMGEPVTLGDVWSTALDYGMAGAPMAAPEGALRANSFRAYHGSPHTFDRFDISKIGTGEGAQAYGHGLYFAGNEAVARGYRDRLALDSGFSYRGQDGLTRDEVLARIEADLGKPYLDNVTTPRGVADGVMDELIYGPATRNFGPQRAALRDQLLSEISRSDPGRMYEVQINADPNSFLNWDAPLSAQPGPVRDAVSSVIPRRMGEDITGQQAYYAVQAPVEVSPGRLINNWTKPLASEKLAQSGIPGISYLDAGSRGVGDGTRNFVVFDDKIIDILRRYGIGAAAIGGGWAMTPEDAQKVNDMGLLNGA